MNLSSTSIDRPVLATVLSVVVVLFGVIGFTYLGVREYPSVDPPIISVQTNYTGASADVIESQITEPLEESINGISGIRSLSSISSDGRSTITVEFELGEDLEAAANDVRDRVAQAQRNLPEDANPPIVTKADADATTILALTVQSDKRSLLELSDIATNTFKERLQTIPGISNIRIWGDKKIRHAAANGPGQAGSLSADSAGCQECLACPKCGTPYWQYRRLPQLLDHPYHGQARNRRAVQQYDHQRSRGCGDQVQRYWHGTTGS